MMLRVFFLVASCTLLSAPAIHARNCTTVEEAWLDKYYASYIDNLVESCESDTCVTVCIDTTMETLSSFPHCTHHDGVNYRELVLSQFSCPTASAPTCTDIEAEDIRSSIFSFSSETCESTPCETACYDSLDQLLGYLPYCTSSDGTYWLGYYSSLIKDCPATGTTKAPELTATSSASSATSTATDASAATTEIPETENSASLQAEASGSTISSEDTEATTVASGSSGSSTTATPSPTPTPSSDAVSRTASAFTAAGVFVLAGILA